MSETEAIENSLLRITQGFPARNLKKRQQKKKNNCQKVYL